MPSFRLLPSACAGNTSSKVRLYGAHSLEVLATHRDSALKSWVMLTTSSGFGAFEYEVSLAVGKAAVTNLSIWFSKEMKEPPRHSRVIVAKQRRSQRNDL
jgi:hypothetical protein